jgi:hypothetical protein
VADLAPASLASEPAKTQQQIGPKCSLHEKRCGLRMMLPSWRSSTHAARNKTNPFYAKVGCALFDACYCALENSGAKANLNNALQVVSSPMGAGKTTLV